MTMVRIIIEEEKAAGGHDLVLRLANGVSLNGGGGFVKEGRKKRKSGENIQESIPSTNEEPRMHEWAPCAMNSCIRDEIRGWSSPVISSEHCLALCG